MAITLLNMERFSKFKNWQMAKNQENPSQLISIYARACSRAKEFFGKLAISQKLEEISKCCQKDFLILSV